ncbi:MAG: urea amidolyase associated protein UAAP2 [Pseudomonadales bacterium]|jgi:urea carboxylase-associated protein 1|nr:urea amidolyase associated protein UAAP2 [Pseudomonadales bacterium]
MTDLRMISSTTIRAGAPFLARVEAGQRCRIVDTLGNEAVDAFFFNADHPIERYSAVDTIRAQRNVYLTTGSTLLSTENRPMLTIVADTVGRHDTLGGACASESNTVRYAHEKKFMHSCRDNFLLALLSERDDLTKRDIGSNVNFFMNVPVTPEGGLSFADGISGPGQYVEMVANMNVLVLISNCPQLNNPCSGFDPTPVEFIVYEAA